MAYVIDREHCTNCGRCTMQCPTHAIGGGMEGPEVDRETCIACGKCAQARDDDFFKGAEDLVPFGEGPYFAVSGGVGTDGAFGGVRVNENIQAYAADRKTLIENLYVPGDFASGRFLNMAGYKVQIINDLSWAMSSGFIAGSHAAELLNND